MTDLEDKRARCDCWEYAHQVCDVCQGAEPASPDPIPLGGDNAVNAMHAKRIRARVAALNSAVWSAYEAGLRVELSVAEISHVARADAVPHLTPIISRLY